MTTSRDPIPLLEGFADWARSSGAVKIERWAREVLGSADAREILGRLVRVGADVIGLLEFSARFHSPARAAFEEAIVGRGVGLEELDLDHPRDIDEFLLGDEPRRPSDPPLLLGQRIRRWILDGLETEDERPRRISAIRKDGSETEVERIPGSRGALVGRAGEPEIVDPGRSPSKVGGRPLEAAEAVGAALVGAHIRAVAPDAMASLAPAFLVHVARYRDALSAGDEVKAERERLRRQLSNPWVRSRVAHVAGLLGIRIALD